MGFEVVGGALAEGRMPPFGIVMGDVVANSEFSCCQAGEVAAAEQLTAQPVELPGHERVPGPPPGQRVLPRRPLFGVLFPLWPDIREPQPIRPC